MAKGHVEDPASHPQHVSSTLSYQTGKRYMKSLTLHEYKRMKSKHDHSPTDCNINDTYLNKNTKEAILVFDEITNY
jgi:hypothetical protein